MSGSSEKTTAERITMVISLVILVATFVLAGWATARTGDEPAQIEVTANLEQVRETETGYYVPITITNSGGHTAQDVMVTGELDTGEGEPETAEVTITFLASDESEEAEIVFQSDPSTGEVSVFPTSYLKP